MLRRLMPTLSHWLPTPKSRRTPRPAPRLGLEFLEAREVPAVLLRPIDQAIEGTIANDKPTFLPVTVTNTPNGAVTTTVTSNSGGLTAEVVQGGRSIRLDVTGTDKDGIAFSGSLTIRLFENAAPLATQRLVDLVNSGFYTDKVFHRIINNFMIQGGSPTGNGVGGSPLPDVVDEFNRDYTFASNGIVAMANAGDDGNDSQFFITDTDQLLADREQHLNFNHSIVGILTDGFDIYQKIINTKVSGETPTKPITITGATVFNDTENAVIKLTPGPGFAGPANVTITATDADGAPGAGTQTLSFTGVNDGIDSRPFISPPIPDQTTTAGTPITFTVPYIDIDGDPGTIVVRNSDFSAAAPNVTVSIDQAARTVTITPNAGFTGTVEFKVGVRQTSAANTNDNYDTQLVRLTVNPAPSNPNPDNPNPSTGPFTAEGSAPGLSGSVTVRNADGSVRFTVPVFDPGFTGGVRVAVGDVTGDDVEDVIAVPAFGGGGIIHVLDSSNGSILRTITVFESSFRGGLYVRVGDAAGRGYDQILVAAGDSGGPRVTLLDAVKNEQLLNFFAGEQTLRGGVAVDLAEVFDGKGMMIVAGLGPGAGPTVALFDAKTSQRVGSFAAGNPADREGIRVRAGDPDSDGVRPIFVAPLRAADGAPEQQFDPSQFVDPDNRDPLPGTTTAAPSTTGLPPNIDLSRLLNQ